MEPNVKVLDKHIEDVTNEIKTNEESVASNINLSPADLVKICKYQMELLTTAHWLNEIKKFNFKSNIVSPPEQGRIHKM